MSFGNRHFRKVTFGLFRGRIDTYETLILQPDAIAPLGHRDGLTHIKSLPGLPKYI
jgi:hypothetical protein